MFTFLNDRLIKEEEAMLHVSDLSIQRGYGIFDFFRTHNNKPLFLDDHLTRFLKSAALLRLEHAYTKERLVEIINQLIFENNMAQSGIRMTLTGGYSPDGYSPASSNLIVTQATLAVTPGDKLKAGVKVITYEYQRALPEIKSINYMMGVWLQQKVKERGAVDVLYHANGSITEFPRASVFMVSGDGQLITNNKNILEGITRKKVLQLAAALYPIVIKDFSADDIKNAAEVFMTSTTKRILPVTCIDDAVIGKGRPGPVTTRLYNAFLELEREQLSV